MPPARAPHPWRRRVAKSLGALGGSILLLLAALIVSLEHRGLRALWLDAASVRISQLIAGQVLVENVEAIDLSGVRGATVRVLDPSGQQVLWVQGLDAEVDTFELLSSLLSDGPVQLRLPRIAIGYADVALDRSPSGSLRLAQAFEPAPPRSVSDGVPAETQGLRLRIERLLAQHAWLHGHTEPWIDAEVDDLSATLTLAGELRVTLVRAAILTRNAPADADLDGSIRGSFRYPLAEPSPPLVELIFRGLVAGALTELRGTLDGAHFSAETRLVLLPELVTSRIAALQPTAPLHLELSASGTRSRFQATARVVTDRTRLQAQAQVVCEAACRAELQLEPSQLEPRLFQPELEATPVAVHGRARLERFSPAPAGSFSLHTGPFQLDGTPAPPITLHGSIDPQTLQLSGHLHEPGLPVNFRLEIPLAAEARVASFSAETPLHRRQPIPRLGPHPRIDGQLRASGRINLTTGRVSAQLRLQADALVANAIEARSLEARVEVRGALGRPRVRAWLSSTDLRLGASAWSWVQAYASGAWPRLNIRLQGRGRPHPSFDQVAVVSAKASLRSLSPLTLASIDVRATATKEQLALSAERLRVDAGIAVQGLELKGAGSLSGDVELAGDRVSLALRSHRLEPQALLAWLPTAPDLRATITGDVVIERIDGEPPHGHALLAVTDLDYRELSGVTVRTSLSAREGALGGHVEVSSDTFGSATLTLAKAPLPVTWSARELRSPRYWREWIEQFEGEAGLDVALQLGRLRDAWWPAQASSWHIDGRLRAHLSLKGTAAGPDWHLWAETDTVGLRRFARETHEGGVTIVDAEDPVWRLDHVDARLAAHFEAATGRTLGDLQLYTGAGNSNLIEGTLATTLPPIGVLVSEPGAWRALGQRQFQALVTIPPQPLAALPADLLPGGTQAYASLRASGHGTFEEPEVLADIHLHDLSTQITERSLPLGVRARLHYQPDRTELWLLGRYEDKPVLEARGTLRGFGPGQADSPRELSANVNFTQFPLGCLPRVRDYARSGRLHGGGQILLRPAEHRVKLDLVLDDGEVQGVPFPEIQASLALDDTQAQVDVDLRQENGRAQVNVRSAIEWPAPALTTPRLVRLDTTRVTARDFELRPLMLLTGDSIRALAGTLNGQATARGSTPLRDARGRFVLTDGLVQVPGLGQQLQNIDGELRIDPNGVLTLTRLTGRGYSGRFSAQGRALLGARGLEHAELKTTIAEQEAMPLTFEGVLIGDVWGEARLEVEHEDEQYTLRARIPKLHVVVPEKADFNVQGLKPSEHVRVGVFLDHGKFRDLAPQEEGGAGSEPLVLEIELGNDVWLHRGRQAKARLHGELRASFAEKLELSGKIRLGQGEIDVLGKRFELARGIVDFNRMDPANPTIVARARWESPAGYDVYAEYRGPAKSGKLELRSDPPLTRSQIVNLLLFDAPEGSLGGGDDGSGGGLAGGVATTLASTGLSEALSDLANLEISARVDTSESETPRPELAVRVSPRLTVELAYNPDQSPLSTTPDHALVTLDWQVARNWALATTVGDRGTSIVDLLWQYRY